MLRAITDVAADEFSIERDELWKSVNNFVELEIDGKKICGPLTAERTAEVIKTLPVGREILIILARSKMTYVQASGDARLGFEVEYQEGSLIRHFRCSDEGVGLEVLLDILQSYRENDDRWRSAVDWHHYPV
jgi:hypothetical protein